MIPGVARISLMTQASAVTARVPSVTSGVTGVTW